MMEQEKISKLTPNQRAKCEALALAFEADGLTFASFEKAARKQSSFLKLNPEAVHRNCGIVVACFQDDGLTRAAYLRACEKRPAVWAANPFTVENNVRHVVATFRRNGLTVARHLKACNLQPQLYYMLPCPNEKRINDHVALFQHDGITTDDFLVAALRQPQLIYQDPLRTERNMNAIKRMHAKGLIDILPCEKDEREKRLGPLWAFVIRNPVCLCFGETNLELREIYGGLMKAMKPAHPVVPERTTNILTPNRSEIENTIARLCGLSPRKKCVQPKDGMIYGLVQRGLIKSLRCAR